MTKNFNAITSERFRNDPHLVLTDLRDGPGIAAIDPGLQNSWHVFRYNDTRAVLLDSEAFASAPLEQKDATYHAANLSIVFDNLISASGDKHRKMRMLGNRVFMPKFIEAFRPFVQEVVNQQMQAALERDTFDMVEGFSAEITVLMIAKILGLPREDKDKIRDWTAVLGSNTGAPLWMSELNPELIETGRRAGEELSEYFTDYLADRRDAPKDGDLISAFMSVEVDGQRLAHDEILSMAILLLLAGNETTTNLITNFTRALEAFPEQAAQLRADPDPARINSAIEETLRLYSSLRYVDRYATRDVEVAGQTIPKGGQVGVWLAVANQDPDVFDHPDSFTPDRQPNRHIGFGQGMHMCLGAPLARMEAQIADQSILTRTRRIELTEPAQMGPNAGFDNVVQQMAHFHAV